MCEMCGNTALKHNAELNRDPTQTKTLRSKYSAEMYKRFRKVKGLIRTTIVDNDAFNLSDRPNVILEATPLRRAGGSQAEKIEGFMDWLQEVEDEVILEAKKRDGAKIVNRNEWQNSYIRSGFQKGIKHAETQLKNQGVKISLLTGDYTVRQLLNRPAYQNRLAVLFKQNFEELKGITNAMNQQIQRRLADGLTRGLNPRKVASMINDRVDKIGITRARTLSRTEIIRSHAEGTLTTYEQQGFKDVTAKVEHSIADDGRTCDICRGLEGEVYKISAAHGKIPVHPNCYDDKTEVYTDEGWKLFKNLEGHEKILSMNPKNLEIDFLNYDKKISYNYKGKMYHLTTNSLDMLVTPNHNQIIGTRSNPKDRSYKSYKIEEIKDIANRSEFYIPRTGKWEGVKTKYVEIGDKKIDVDIFARFMGFYLSEGSVTKRSKNHYAISIHQNQPNKDKMYNLIKGLPYKVNNGSQEKIYIYDSQLGKYLMKLGKSATKYIPEEIKQLPPNKIDIFLNAFAMGDGSIKNTTWAEKNLKSKEEMTLFTTSKKLADDLGEIIVKAGYYPSYKIQEVAGKEQKFSNGTYAINNDLYRIRRNRSKYAYYSKYSQSGIKIEKVNYSGKVYDVELPKWHVLWVRRNGKTVWSGNCRCAWLPVVDKSTGGQREAAATTE